MRSGPSQYALIMDECFFPPLPIEYVLRQKSWHAHSVYAEKGCFPVIMTRVRFSVEHGCHVAYPCMHMYFYFMYKTCTAL